MHVVWGYPINIKGNTLLADLVVFQMQGFDVILGMDWLAKDCAIIDCADKEVTFRPLRGEEITFVRSRAQSLLVVLSAV